MNIEVRFRDLEPTEALKNHAVRRVETSLDRFTNQLTQVLVQLADINGPKGGRDKRCQLTLRGPTLGSLNINELSGEVASAIDAACELASRSVARELERARDIRRSARPPSGGPS
jgi:putative sigma-54 modulation protein